MVSLESQQQFDKIPLGIAELENHIYILLSATLNVLKLIYSHVGFQELPNIPIQPYQIGIREVYHEDMTSCKLNNCIYISENMDGRYSYGRFVILKLGKNEKNFRP